MNPQVLLPPGAGLVLEQVRLCDAIMHLTVRCEAPGANCPRCGAWSEAFHRGHVYLRDLVPDYNSADATPHARARAVVVAVNALGACFRRDR